MGEKLIKVKPAEDLSVRDPRLGKPKFLPVEGDTVPNDPYWRRRINDGDVMEVTA
jgi:hypothetical protein